MAELTRQDIIKLIAANHHPICLQGVDLSSLDLTSLDLSQVNFSYANLEKTNLAYAYLRGAILYRKTLLGPT